MTVREIQTPLDETTVRSLRVGDEVALSGLLVTARDVAWSLERTRRHPRSGVSHDLADVVPWCLS